MTYWQPYGGPIFHEGKFTCPWCSQYTGMEASWYDPPVMVSPVYCIKRVNKQTQDTFWGCPNFPKCKYSYNKPRTQYVEIFEEDEMCCDDFQC